jgi:hypothetical protein
MIFHAEKHDSYRAGWLSGNILDSVLELLGSNFIYPELFVIFLSLYRQMSKQFFSYDTVTTFEIFFSSSFIYHPDLYEYTLTTDSVI